MNKQELIDQISQKAEINKKLAAAALDAALDTIVSTVAEGNRVQLVGFGSFEPKNRKARIGHNPKTKETVEIPASTVPVFKPGKAFKDQVSK